MWFAIVTIVTTRNVVRDLERRECRAHAAQLRLSDLVLRDAWGEQKETDQTGFTESLRSKSPAKRTKPLSLQRSGLGVKLPWFLSQPNVAGY
jgi:hypothetical protein